MRSRMHPASGGLELQPEDFKTHFSKQIVHNCDLNNKERTAFLILGYLTNKY